MARIGLIDVDSHRFPNLPLMKLSAHHRRRGDAVEWYDGLKGSSVGQCYDVVYMSKVYDFTPDYDSPLYADTVIKGGTGYGSSAVLDDCVEREYPDYSLYPEYPEAYGFLTRGCPRGCEFCVVSSKEGKISKRVGDLSDFWRGQKDIKLLDPNLFACVEREVLLEQLIDSGAYIDFTQGLDIRLMDKELAGLIMKCKIKVIRFAWDGLRDSDFIVRKLLEFKKQTNVPMYKARVYVLTNFDTEFGFDLERVYRLRSMGYDPYVMIYDKQNAPKNVRHLQGWVNNKRIFRKCERFEDFNPSL